MLERKWLPEQNWTSPKRWHSTTRFSRPFSLCHEMRLGKTITHMENRIANTIAKCEGVCDRAIANRLRTVCDVVTCIWKPSFRVRVCVYTECLY